MLWEIGLTLSKAGGIIFIEEEKFESPYDVLIKFTKALVDAPSLAIKYIIEHETDERKKSK